MLLRLVPSNTKIRFMRFAPACIAVSLIMIIASYGLLFVRGLNLGIDFRGGTIVQIHTEGPADLAQIRSIVGDLGLGDVAVQEFGAVDDVLIRMETQVVSSEELAADPTANEKAQQAAVNKVQEALRGALGEGVRFDRVEVIGPKVSGELVQKAVVAVSLAVILMLFYIWIRFEYQFSIGAILALIHDVSLTIGLFSLTQIEFNLSIIAAVLLIVGYSMNDTVVVFDRIRENLRKYKKMPTEELLDHSINETLSRTVMTSVTTLLALTGLYVLGGEVIRGFVFAMIFGILIGTYSSIFIGAPALNYTGVKRDWSGLSNQAANPA